MANGIINTISLLPLEQDSIVITEEHKKKLRVEEEKEAEELEKKAIEKAQKAISVKKEDRKKKATTAAFNRHISEAETRYLIDDQLRKAGWEADTEKFNYKLHKTLPQAGHNMAIAEWKTDSTVYNSGYADYALFVGERLVGIVEAKAMYKDISAVIDGQGKEYPKNIRKEDEKYAISTWGEYKVPFTFATNGRPYLEQYRVKSGIWFLDLRKLSNIAEPKRGWMSPDGIMELLEKDIEAGNKELSDLSYDMLKDTGLNLRDYQIKAIQAAENAIINGRDRVLLAMATGTGKTRTVLGMIYRFLKTNRFRRILFLVDRKSLGEQAYDVFKEVKLERLMTLDNIYSIKGLDEKTIDKETRIQVATVQGMVKRILYNNEDTMPAISDFDLIIVDDERVIIRTKLEKPSKYKGLALI